MDESVKDPQTVDEEGRFLESVPNGVTFRDVATHVDDRGAVIEMFNPRWGWHPEPLVHAYVFTVRPGAIKGWGLHKKSEDRYCILFGEVEVVMYDERQDSATFGLVSKVVLSEYQRRLMNIPVGIWHAARNIGERDAVLLNFKTKPYDPQDPDKYRLPLTTDRIPHTFENPRGG